VIKADILTMQRTIRGAQETNMRAISTIYEGDSIIHHGGSATQPKATQPAPGVRVRSPLGFVGNAFRALFGWIEAAAERARYRELERYLADSGDVFELERRMRKVELRYGATIDPYA